MPSSVSGALQGTPNTLSTGALGLLRLLLGLTPPDRKIKILEILRCYRPGRIEAVKERETSPEGSGANSRDPGGSCQDLALARGATWVWPRWLRLT
jgi:hypothetical protein